MHVLRFQREREKEKEKERSVRKRAPQPHTTFQSVCVCVRMKRKGKRLQCTTAGNITPGSGELLSCLQKRYRTRWNVRMRTLVRRAKNRFVFLHQFMPNTHIHTRAHTNTGQSLRSVPAACAACVARFRRLHTTDVRQMDHRRFDWSRCCLMLVEGFLCVCVLPLF